MFKDRESKREFELSLQNNSRCKKDTDIVLALEGNINEVVITFWKNVNIYQENDQFVFIDKLNNQKYVTYKRLNNAIKRLIYSEIEMKFSTKAINDIVKEICDGNELAPTYTETLDDTTIYFNNMSFNIKSGELVEGSYNNKRTINSDLHINYSHKRYLDFINSYTLGQEKDFKQSFSHQIEEMILATLLPTKIARKAFILYGEGYNGKSTLNALIYKIWGDKSTSLTIPYLDNSFVRKGLVGKQVNIIDDFDNITYQQSGQFKSIVSGEMVYGEEKYGGGIQFNNEATFILGTNVIPKFKVEDLNAMLDRLQFIPFIKRFSKNESVVIDDELVKSTLAYIVKNAKSIYERTNKLRELTFSSESKRIRNTYITTHNPLLLWFNEEFENTMEDKEYIEYNRLRDILNSWLKSNKYQTYNTSMLGKLIKPKLEKLGYITKQLRVGINNKRVRVIAKTNQNEETIQKENLYEINL